MSSTPSWARAPPATALKTPRTNSNPVWREANFATDKKAARIKQVRELVEGAHKIRANRKRTKSGNRVEERKSDKIFNARRPPTNVIFALMEIVGLLMVFFGPPGQPLFMTVAFFIYGFGLTGLVTSLGGLFALDIAPKRAAGAAMGFIGVCSYIGAALQDQISGHLIEKGITIVDGVRHYDFSAAILFWIGMSVVSFILATSLWRVRVRD